MKKIQLVGNDEFILGMTIPGYDMLPEYGRVFSPMHYSDVQDDTIYIVSDNTSAGFCKAPNVVNNIRQCKATQSVVLRNAGIRTPETLILDMRGIVRSTEITSAILVNPRLSSSEHLVLKSTTSASGEGQICFPFSRTGDMLTFLMRHWHNPIKHIPSWMLYNGIDKDSTMKSFIGPVIVLQEKVKVVREWRVVFNCVGSYICYERQRDDGWQATGYTPDSTDELHTSTCDVKDKLIRQVIVASGYMYGSLDIYEDTEGNHGIFEYSNEFGQRGYPIKQIRDLIAEGVVCRAKQITGSETKTINVPVKQTSEDIHVDPVQLVPMIVKRLRHTTASVSNGYVETIITTISTALKENKYYVKAGEPLSTMYTVQPGETIHFLKDVLLRIDSSTDFYDVTYPLLLVVKDYLEFTDLDKLASEYLGTDLKAQELPLP